MKGESGIMASTELMEEFRLLSRDGRPAGWGDRPEIEALESRVLLDATVAQGALGWSSYLGHSGNDQATAVAVDAADNVFVAGYTYSSNDTQWISGGHDTTYGGSADGFIVKLSQTGEHVWSTYLGGVGDDRIYDIAVDTTTGNVVVTGYTSSPNNDGWINGGYDTTLSGDKDAFVAVFDSDGVFQWSTYIGETQADIGYGVAFDVNGNVIVGGYTMSPNTEGWISGGYDTTHGGHNDGFVVKISAAGEHVWSTYLGGELYDFAQGIATDSSGHIFVTGATQTAGWISGGYDLSHGGQNDAFLVKLSDTGGHVWSTYLGGSSNDFGYDVAVDSTGYAMVVGYSMSAGWVSGGMDEDHNGGRDGFVAKFDSAGVHAWSSYLGGDADDEAHGVAIDGDDNILVTGRTYSTDWTADGFDTTHNGSRDGFVVKLDTAGSEKWSTFLGGSEEDFAPSVAVNSVDHIVVAGYSFSSGWIANGYDVTFGGMTDGFVAQIIIRTLSGAVWADLNGNGVRDAGDYGLEGWKVYVDENSNGVFDSGEQEFTTDSSGRFYINDLEPGTHGIRLETANENWSITTPGAQLYTVKLIGDQAVASLDFGNLPVYCSLAGNVFNDVGDDGGEFAEGVDEVLADWKVFLDEDGDGTWDDGEKSALTDENGDYQFIELIPGTYHVTVEVPEQWQQTFDADELVYEIVMEAGDAADGLNFGVYRYVGFIEGYVWDDVDGNGVFDGDETGLKDWRVYADLDFDRVWDADEPYDFPDADGYYLIEDIKPGTYLIVCEANDFWQQTTPTDVIFTQDFEAGLSSIETLAGMFTLNDTNVQLNPTGSMVIGHGTEYTNNEYSYYELKLNLKGISNVTLEFDYALEFEDEFDLFNVQAAVSSISPPNNLVDPAEASDMQYRSVSGVGSRAELGKEGFDGYGELVTGHAVFDLSDFEGESVVKVRLQFGSDINNVFAGINIDNVMVHGEGNMRVATWPHTVVVKRGATTSGIDFGQKKLPDGDLDGNGVVDLLDLTTLGENYNTYGGCTKEMGDTDGDGNINLTDLVNLGETWGLTGRQMPEVQESQQATQTAGEIAMLLDGWEQEEQEIAWHTLDIGDV